MVARRDDPQLRWRAPPAQAVAVDRPLCRRRLTPSGRRARASKAASSGARTTVTRPRLSSSGKRRSVRAHFAQRSNSAGEALGLRSEEGARADGELFLALDRELHRRGDPRRGLSESRRALRRRRCAAPSAPSAPSREPPASAEHRHGGPHGRAAHAHALEPGEQVGARARRRGRCSRVVAAGLSWSDRRTLLALLGAAGGRSRGRLR